MCFFLIFDGKFTAYFNAIYMSENFFTISVFIMTNVLSKNFDHSFGGEKKKFIAFISMCCITNFAIVTEIEEPIGTSNIC